MCKGVGLYSNSQIHLAKMFNSSKADALRNWEERKKKWRALGAKEIHQQNSIVQYNYRPFSQDKKNLSLMSCVCGFHTYCPIVKTQMWFSNCNHKNTKCTTLKPLGLKSLPPPHTQITWMIFHTQQAATPDSFPQSGSMLYVWYVLCVGLENQVSTHRYKIWIHS